MSCSFSGLNALYDAVNGGGDVWINENRFRILRQLGEGGFAYVFLAKEGLNALYDAVNSGGDIWINENRFKILRQLREGGFAYVFLAKEVISDPSNPGISKKIKDFSCL